MDLDQIYERIGGCGRQQRLYVFIILLSQFLGALHHVFLVFAGDPASFYCFDGNSRKHAKLDFLAKNKSEALTEACSQYNAGDCDDIIYTGSWKTVNIEFDLICKDAYKVSLAQSVYMGGVLVGSLVFGFIADIIGRVKTVYLTSLVVVLSSFALGSSTSFSVFIALRFTIGFGVAGFALAAYVLGSELIGQEVRGIYVVLTSSAFAVGICLLTGMAMMMINWRQLSNSVALVTLGLSLLFLFANSAVYYGLTMASGGLSDNLYTSVALSGLAELPSYLVVFVLEKRLGRRTLVCGNMIVGGLSCASIMFLRTDQASLRTSLALLGKMGISASFALIYLHSTELFPTTMRNAALGVCSMSARIGGVIAPFISMIGNSYPSKEFVVFGAICLSSGLLNLQLPETAGTTLPESLSDLLQLKQRGRRNAKVFDSSSMGSPLIRSRHSSPDLFAA